MNIETNNQSITTDMPAPNTIYSKNLNKSNESYRGGSTLRKETSSYNHGKNLMKTASINQLFVQSSEYQLNTPVTEV